MIGGAAVRFFLIRGLTRGMKTKRATIDLAPRRLDMKPMSTREALDMEAAAGRVTSTNSIQGGHSNPESSSTVD
jgi:hypothetical protein